MPSTCRPEKLFGTNTSRPVKADVCPMFLPRLNVGREKNLDLPIRRHGNIFQSWSFRSAAQSGRRSVGGWWRTPVQADWRRVQL